MTKILVVDDDRNLVAELVELLRSEDFAPVAAYDRQSAETAMETSFFPIILADLRLHSEAEGLMLLSSIAKLSPRSGVATLTAFASEESQARIRELGARMVMFKPVPADELIAAVREMLAEIEAVAEVLPGSSDDIEALFTAVSPILYAIPQRKYGLTADEANELVQEVWLLYMEKRSNVQKPRAWLSGAIVNLCRQHIQNRYRGVARTERVMPFVTDRGERHDEATIAVRQALGRLDARGRELCLRIGMEQQSYDEVAAAMSLPIGSVGPLYMRAKARMKKELQGVA